MSSDGGKLAGKVAVVTGASKGIGASVARHLAEAGAAVVVNYASSRAGADRVVGEIAASGGRAVAVQADLSNPADIRRLFAETMKAFGRVDVLVNNAGVYEFVALDAITPEHFHKIFNLNVLGLILASQEAVQHFPASGGVIVNISSVASMRGFPAGSVYCGSKGAVDAVTRALAAELGPRNIRVNAVNPGMVATEGVQAVGLDSGEMRKQAEAQTPLGRIAQPQDIARAVVFMASPDSGWMTGETMFLTGGFR